MRKHKLRKGIAAAAIGAMLSGQFAAPLAWAKDSKGGQSNAATVTPIKHLIVLIGENRIFDHTFATYRPQHGQTVAHLLSKGIVSADGSPGPKAALATQNSVNTPLPATYFISSNNKTAYSPLPTPELNGAPNQQMPLGPTAPFNDSVSDSQLQQLELSIEPSALNLHRSDRRLGNHRARRSHTECNRSAEYGLSVDGAEYTV